MIEMPIEIYGDRLSKLSKAALERKLIAVVHAIDTFETHSENEPQILLDQLSEIVQISG